MQKGRITSSMGNSEHEMKNVKGIRPIFSSANS